MNLAIHDIKPLVTIPDYSLYIFITLVILGVILCSGILYFLYKMLRGKKDSPEKISFKFLKDLDLSNSKEAAYFITKHGRVIAKTPRETKLLDELILHLESYKYKKEVPSLDDETKQQFERFMDAVDVK